MNKYLIFICSIGMCAASFISCKKDAPKDTNEIANVKEQPQKIKLSGSIQEEEAFSIIVPDEWKMSKAHNSISIKKPRPDNGARFSIYIETLAFDMSMKEYLEQSEMAELKKLGEYTFGKYKWTVYDNSERGYPAMYLTEYPSRDRVLCVKASGMDVLGMGNPDVELFLEGISLK